MKPSRNILSFAINGSLRKREVQPQTPYTEYYLFNSAANLKAYSNNGLDFAYYGYNATITQGFLYAPFGEITTEYAPLWQNGTLPKYAFKAKELDEETGMYYYEARYYKPPVFTSRDPMMDQKPWLTPYHYCSNNPVRRVDPSGCDDEDDMDKWRYNTDTKELKWLSDEGGDNHQIVEFVHNGKDGKLYYNNDKVKEYDGYIGDLFVFSALYKKWLNITMSIIDIYSGGATCLAGITIGAGGSILTGGAAVGVGAVAVSVGAAQFVLGLKNFSEAIAYQYHSPSIEQQIVKNMCIQYAHIVGSTSTDIVANIAAYSSPTNRIPNRYQNATSLAVAIGYCVWLNYNITHPEQLE